MQKYEAHFSVFSVLRVFSFFGYSNRTHYSVIGAPLPSQCCILPPRPTTTTKSSPLLVVRPQRGHQESYAPRVPPQVIRIYNAYARAHTLLDERRFFEIIQKIIITLDQAFLGHFYPNHHQNNKTGLKNRECSGRHS